MLRVALAILFLALVFGTAWAPAHSKTNQRDLGPELSEIFQFEGTGPCGCPRY